MHTMSVETAYAASGLLCSGRACVSDLQEGRIPNGLSVAGILLGLSLHAILGGRRELFCSAACGFFLGTFFLAFYLLGGMGAGDVKIGTALGCLLGSSFWKVFFMGTTVSGAVLALTFLFLSKHPAAASALTRTFKGFRTGNEPRCSRPSLAIPYALPLFLGCCCSAFQVLTRAGAR